MSSESDSDLDFESADEGNKLDSLDDISLSDDSDVEEPLKSKNQSKETESKQTASQDPSKEAIKEVSCKIEEISKEVPQSTDDEPQEDLKNENKFDSTTKNNEEQTQTNSTSGDGGGFEIEEIADEEIDAQLDKEIDRIENKLENELKIDDSHAKNTEVNPKIASESANKKSEEPKTADKEANAWSTAWDDMNFSDVEAEDDESENKNEEIKPQTTLEQVKKVEESIKKVEQPVKKVEEPKRVEKDAVKPQSGGWSWSKFGSSLLNTATSSGLVATLTTHLNDGINTVLESVDASIGAPDPLELAKKTKTEREQVESKKDDKNDVVENDEENSNEMSDWNSHSDWFSVLPNKLATTGKQLVTGSLDVLENVGKKTIEVLNDKDPNLRNTREFFKIASDVTAVAGKPNLSQMLREAKDAAEKLKQEIPQSNSETNLTNKTSRKQDKICFASYFDEYKGLVYLEALEMLSFQTNSKLEMKLLNVSKSVQKQIDSFKNVFNLDKLLEEADEDDEEEFDFENLNDLIIDYFSELNLKISIDNLVQAFKTASVATKSELNGSELHDEAIKCLALISSKLIEFFHKTAEMALVLTVRQEKNAFRHSFDQAENIYNISKLCVRSVTTIANDFNRNLKKRESVSNQLVANIFLEASNCNTYIGDGFMLLAPIFKTLALDDSQ